MTAHSHAQAPSLLPPTPPHHRHSHSSLTLTCQGNSYPDSRGSCLSPDQSLLQSQKHAPSEGQRQGLRGLFVTGGRACPVITAELSSSPHPPARTTRLEGEPKEVLLRHMRSGSACLWKTCLWKDLPSYVLRGTALKAPSFPGNLRSGCACPRCGVGSGSRGDEGRRRQR